MYSPMMSEDQLQRIQDSGLRIRQIGKENKAIFYRAEFDTVSRETDSSKLKAESYTKAFEEMQPEHTLVLDITEPENEILNQMKPKGRYNIKVAQKNHIRVVEETDTSNFFKLYSEMARRHKITHRSSQYFQNLFDILGTKGYCKVFTAFAITEKQRNKETKEPMNHKTPIASVIISFYKEKAIYLFGGSSDEHKNLMAPYLLQWHAIKEAKERGCTKYDFFGIAPPNKPNHPWRGVTDFKKKFGGEEEEILGSWDLVLKPTEYRLFRIAENLRRT